MIGFDYGVKPKIMIVGDVGFSQLITEAEILALGYINIPKDKDDCSKLRISIIFNDDIKGKMVVDRFIGWTRKFNSMDAFELDIIEKNDNSYLLCFSQNEKLLLERSIPNAIHDWIEPIITKVTHFKPIQNRSDLYYKFKEACKFSKCNIYAGDKSGRVNDINNVIVKENIKFYKEDEITEESHLFAFNGSDNMKMNGKNIESKNVDIQDNMIRIKNIKYFFPITYNKIINYKYFNEALEELTNSFDKYIIIQAICNIVLAYRLQEENIEINDYKAIDVINYLVNNYEKPNSKFPNDNDYTSKMVLEQIEIDKKLGGR